MPIYEHTHASTKRSSDAFNRIVKLVEIADRPIQQMRQRLIAEGYGEVEVDEAIEKARAYRILDDDRYARVYCMSHVRRGEGCAGLLRHLQSLDINIDDLHILYEGEPFPFEEEREVERALSVLNRKRPSGNNLRDKAYRTLMRKGYASSVSSTAARQWCATICTVSEAKSSDFFI